MVDTSVACKGVGHDFVELAPNGGVVRFHGIEANPTIYCRKCGEVRSIPIQITYNADSDPLRNLPKEKQ